MYNSTNSWDVLVKNMFDNIDGFNSLENRIKQPADVYEDENGLTIEIACVDVDKQNISVLCEGDIIRFSYKKPEENDSIERVYAYRGIRRGSFDLSWKIAPKYDLQKASVSLDKGILKFTAPFCEEKSTCRNLEIQ